MCSLLSTLRSCSSHIRDTAHGVILTVHVAGFPPAQLSKRCLIILMHDRIIQFVLQTPPVSFEISSDLLIQFSSI